MVAIAKQIRCLCALFFVLEASAHWRGHARRRNSENHWMPSWWQDFDARDATGMPKWQRKICNKMGHLAGMVPGLDDCKGASDQEHHGHHSAADLKHKLEASQETSKNLRRELANLRREVENEGNDKRQKINALERQLQAEQKQTMQLKSKLEGKVKEIEKERVDKRNLHRELENEKDDKRQKINDLQRQLHEEQEQTMHLKSKLEGKDRTIKDRIHSWNRRRRINGIYGARINGIHGMRGIHGSECLTSSSCADKLQKAKVDKQQKEKQLSALERQLLDEQGQVNHLKSKLQATVDELEKERVQKEHRVRQEGDQAASLQSKLEAKIRDMEQAARTKERQLGIERGRAYQAHSELKMLQSKMSEAQWADLDYIELLLQNVSDATLQAQQEKLNAEEERIAFEIERRAGLNLEKRLGQAQIVVVATVAAALLALAWMRLMQVRLDKELQAKASEVDAASEQLSSLEEEFNSELGGMMKMSLSSHNLGEDFSFHIFDEQADQGTVRSIKIQCPGVRHSDVSVEIIFNGCTVAINRQASHGINAAEWVQKFQFRPSEGLFEFKEDQATLDCGILTLVFRAYAFQSRPFRFPMHFNLSAADVDGTWEFPQESAAGHGTEPSMHGTAPGRLEMTAAIAEEFANVAPAARGAETSGSPVDTDDYEAVVAQVAMQGSASTLEKTFENVEVSQTTLADLVIVTQEAPAEDQDADSPEITEEAAGARTLSQTFACLPSASSSEGTSEDFEKLQEEDMSPEESAAPLEKSL